jgi:Flp pilus assembly protein TadD
MQRSRLRRRADETDNLTRCAFECTDVWSRPMNDENNPPAADDASDGMVASASVDLGKAAFMEGRLCDAEQELRAFLEAEPNNPIALRRLGTLYYVQRRLPKAREALEKASRLNPLDPDTLNNLGVVLRDLKDHVEAVKCFAKALQLVPDDPDTLFNIGLSGIAVMDFDDAELRFRKVLELRPGDIKAKIQLAHLRGAAGDYQASRTILEEAAGAHPDDPEIKLELAGFHAGRGDLETASEYTQAALALRPDYPDALNQLGVLYGRRGEFEEAVAAFRRAVALAPSNERFQRNLREVYQRLVPDWHLPMLNDLRRNDAYQGAIERAVANIGDGVVLDIGTGSGLLAMMAARGGAKRVIGCEMLPALAETAERIVEENGYADQIKIFPKPSTELQVGVELPERASLIIAEIFDTVLIGEGVLPTIRHALRELGTPDVQILPAGAAAWGVVIQCDELRRINPVTEVSGFDLSAMDAFRSPSAAWAFDRQHHKHVELSKPFEIARFDFSNPPVGEIEAEFQIPAIASGTAHGIALWFDLHLDRRETFSSRPGGPLDHWHQSLLFLDRDLPVTNGQVFDLVLGHNETRFIFRVKD